MSVAYSLRPVISNVPKHIGVALGKYLSVFKETYDKSCVPDDLWINWEIDHQEDTINNNHYERQINSWLKSQGLKKGQSVFFWLGDFDFND